MYLDRVVEVGKAANGFIVSANVPLKPEAKSTKTMDCCRGSVDRQYICKDAKEAADVIGDLIPLLDEAFKTGDEFDKAFAEATGSAEDEKEDGK